MSNHDHQLTLGVIGCGHWGPNHIRVFSELQRSRVRACADLNPSKLEQMRRRFPGIRTTLDYRDLLDDDAIEAVVIATPTGTHAEVTRNALRAGKHVLIEKPLCTRSAEAAELELLAGAAERVLMVGHVYLFNAGVIKLRELVESGALGRIHYLDAVRTNLGPIRGDVNAVYDLGSHDISIFNHLLGQAPVEVSAVGRCISQEQIEDVCFVTLKYPDGALGHIHVSWLNPSKVRTLTVVGERQMALWDDVSPFESLRLYDKGIRQQPHYDSFGEFQYLLRNEDVRIPRIERSEPLVNQANAFLDCVLDGGPCRSGGAEGRGVVEVLEAATESSRLGGSFCPVQQRPSTPRQEAATPKHSRTVSLAPRSRYTVVEQAGAQSVNAAEGPFVEQEQLR
ncbi:MAG: Gfo/Idh/MocA family oxidoreductase [Phycisphaerae bacterium]